MKQNSIKKMLLIIAMAFALQPAATYCWNWSDIPGLLPMGCFLKNNWEAATFIGVSIIGYLSMRYQKAQEDAETKNFFRTNKEFVKGKPTEKTPKNCLWFKKDFKKKRERDIEIAKKFDENKQNQQEIKYVPESQLGKSSKSKLIPGTNNTQPNKKTPK